MVSPCVDFLPSFFLSSFLFQRFLLVLIARIVYRTLRVLSLTRGYELHSKTGLLQGDISIGNRILSNDHAGHWPAVLIDSDLTIREQREASSGAKGKTGTRAFMAIGLLFGEKHTFTHGLESFFWVLFWIVYMEALARSTLNLRDGITSMQRNWRIRFWESYLMKPCGGWLKAEVA
ncbi:hypothetical protein BDV32DRAFT_67009 [Aspergillus pseudonomiae]|nr:hypothetical protein BDV32DRAFT_67009 [Aspergillus pseudonomiae]